MAVNLWYLKGQVHVRTLWRPISHGAETEDEKRGTKETDNTWNVEISTVLLDFKKETRAETKSIHFEMLRTKMAILLKTI